VISHTHAKTLCRHCCHSKSGLRF